MGSDSMLPLPSLGPTKGRLRRQLMGIGLALAPALAAAQSGSCLERLVPYDQDAAPVSHLELRTSSAGALYYFAAEHSYDAFHPQVRRIERTFRDFEPTVAYYEGHQEGVATSRNDTVWRFGEAGLVRHLAADRGIPAFSLEPEPGREIGYLLERFDAEKVKLFFLLREAVRLRQRQRMVSSEIRGVIADRLGGLPRLEDVITNLQELQQVYRRYWTYPPHWWEAPSDWFDPRRSSASTGGVFTNDVNRASSEFRNRNMLGVLSRSVRRGERVFAVVGGDHVVRQEPALRCALE